MSELVVVGFADKYKADQVLLDLLKLEHDHLADLEDAVVVITDAQSNVRVKPYHDLVRPGDLSNELWGGILSSIVFHRSIELVDDPLAGQIEIDFVTEAKALLQPNSSALFVIIQKADPDSVIAILQKSNGKVLRTVYAGEPII